MKLEGSTAPGCPRCGDQTLWSMSRDSATGWLTAWCRLCGHTWDYQAETGRGELEKGTSGLGPSVRTACLPRPVFACDNPEAEWIKDQLAGDPVLDPPEYDGQFPKEATP